MCCGQARTDPLAIIQESGLLPAECQDVKEPVAGVSLGAYGRTADEHEDVERAFATNAEVRGQGLKFS